MTTALKICSRNRPKLSLKFAWKLSMKLLCINIGSKTCNIYDSFLENDISWENIFLLKYGLMLLSSFKLFPTLENNQFLVYGEFHIFLDSVYQKRLEISHKIMQQNYQCNFSMTYPVIK